MEWKTMRERERERERQTDREKEKERRLKTESVLHRREGGINR